MQKTQNKRQNVTWRNKVCIKGFKGIECVLTAGFLDSRYFSYLFIVFNLAVLILSITQLVQFSVDTVPNNFCRKVSQCEERKVVCY